MTGTAATEADEFMDIYKLEVVEIPTNRPVSRASTRTTRSTAPPAEKYKAIVARDRGLPPRRASRSWSAPPRSRSPSSSPSFMVEQGYKLIDFDDPKALEPLYQAAKNGVPSKIFAVLNARYHEQEAFIVAQAGVPGAVTIATNMAGRGTDIQLGGNADMRVAASSPTCPRARARGARAPPSSAEVGELKQKALAAGGLYVIGTERHESRRIDNQLRGRSGRQGDPGRSKFFLSLQDDLMRIFGSERMDGMLQKLGLKEGEAIVHPWINKALEKAQQKVEARNFDIRKNILKYDDVMNDQRKVIFEQRRDFMARGDVARHDRRHAPRRGRRSGRQAHPRGRLSRAVGHRGPGRGRAAPAQPRAAGRRLGQGRGHRRRGDARAHQGGGRRGLCRAASRRTRPRS